MNRLRIDTQFASMFEELNLGSFSKLVAYFTRDAKLRGEVFVTRATLQHRSGDVEVFFKLYSYARPGWRFWNRASKAQREFENYQLFESLRVPVAKRVAVGEERDAIGRLKRAFVITVAVPGARTLIEFFESKPSEKDRKRLLSELAQHVRAMHTANFFHHDLVWRNVLVDSLNELRLIDCPRGDRARVGRERKRLRDLASLDKSAWRFCRGTERLRFVLAYLGAERVDETARKLIADCLAYRRERWPEDWGGK